MGLGRLVVQHVNECCLWVCGVTFPVCSRFMRLRLYFDIIDKNWKLALSKALSKILILSYYLTNSVMLSSGPHATFYKEATCNACMNTSQLSPHLVFSRRAAQ